VARAADRMSGVNFPRRFRMPPLRDRLAGFTLDDPRLTTALAHYAALAASLVILVTQRPAQIADQLSVWLIIAIGISVLRVGTVTRRPVITTVVLDAVAMALFLSGTGAPDSPFFLLVLAGAWWAAHAKRSRSGLAYGLAFAAAYAALVLPAGLSRQALGPVIEQVAAVIAIGGLCDWIVNVDRRVLALNEALHAAPPGTEELAIRDGLARAFGSGQVPIDVVLAAGQVGLTAAHVELLSYLVLGLSNLEIADAAGLSEATIRYRLTDLYRALGVRGRRMAVSRARELGLGRYWHTSQRPNE
jgi:DNA-binding CsgD family transcriptional regulator